MSTLDLATISESGQPPRSRIKDVASLRSIYNKIDDADSASSRNRSLWRAMVDGEPPYNQVELDESGQGDRSNVDLGYGRAAISTTQSGYYDLISSVPTLINPVFKATYKSEAERAEWGQIISEGFTRMLRRWKRFHFNFLLLTHWFIEDGVAVTYFEDNESWQFRVDSLQNVKIPRGAEADESALDLVFIKRRMRVDELYAKIESEEEAGENGWDVSAAKQLLLDVTHEGSDDGKLFDDWESLQEEIKNNDLACGYARSQEIPVVHALVKEFSGKISHYIFTEDAVEDGDDYLMKRLECFDNMEQVARFFTIGVGNGTYHSIRGKGFEVYPFAGILNELGNSIIDGAKLSTAVVIQPQDNSTRALDDLALSYYGPFGILPPGFKAVERALPNFANNAIPAMSLLQQQMQNNTGSYDARAVTPDGQARTATEIKAQLQREASLSNSAVDLFYMHWGPLLNEVFRRARRKDYGADEPGGREVANFRLYCKARGVPDDALDNIEYVEPMRAVGLGSPAQRQLAHDEAATMAGALDEQGRENLLRDRLADRFGYDLVDRYRPRSSAQLRPAVDEKVALMESALMRTGSQVPVVPGENHFIHAKVHIADLLQVAEALGSEQMEPPQAFGVFQIELPHTEQHLAQIIDDPTRATEVGSMRQVFQQLSAMATRLGDSLQAAAQQQQEAEAAEQQRAIEAEQARVRQLEQQAAQTQDPTASAKVQAMLAETQAKIQTMFAEADARMRIKEVEAAQKLIQKNAPQEAAPTA